MSNLKYYWFLILVLLVAFYRIDFSCFSRECLLEENSAPFFVGLPIFLNIRERCVEYVDRYFPSPHSELLLGMTVGLDRLAYVPKFKTALKRTGTIHVVVVSGFNISLVFNSILKILGSKYRLKNLMIAQLITVFYAILTGFEPPVVRALVMGSTISWGKYYGRTSDTLLVLVTSGLIMVIIQPLYFFNLSFLLSFSATLGLILFSAPLTKVFLHRIFKVDAFSGVAKFPLFEDFVSGLSAQLLVWPILSYFFGTVSLISLVVNTLILWTVSFTTIFGTIFLMVAFVSNFLASLFLIPLYVLLDVFVEAVMLFDKLPFGYLDFKISTGQMVAYYSLLLVVLVFGSFRGRDLRVKP